jgi:hypothetical protein
MPEKTQSEIVYNRLTELVGQGSSLADAVRKVAGETGKTENAVRALRHNYIKKLEGGGRRAVKRARSGPLSPEQAVAEAKKLLSGALGAVDRELEAARTELGAAQARYDKLAATINERKSELERKIKALG